MGWRDTLDAAIQKGKDKTVETVMLDKAKKTIHAIAVAAGSWLADEDVGKCAADAVLLPDLR